MILQIALGYVLGKIFLTFIAMMVEGINKMVNKDK